MRRPLLLLAAVVLLTVPVPVSVPVSAPVSASTSASYVDPVGSWPLAPQPNVVEGFDPPSSTWDAGHRGVDLAGYFGQRVLAALDGRVSFAGTIAGKGVVAVDHGATRTTYEPVVTELTLGDRVTEGQPIGTLVLPGSHCLPDACLHWGWIEGEIYLDPLRLVGAALPVRLLPLDGLPAGSLSFAPWRPLPTPYVDWQPLLRLLRPGSQP